MTARLGDMSWTELREVLKKPNVVIIPLGSTEEHGAHLPVKFDSLSATYIAENAAQKVVDEHNICVLVAPTIDYTEVSHHKRFPGTIGVKADTLTRMFRDIVGSFLDQGFNNIILLTAHWENCAPMEVALTMIKDDYPKANLFGLSTMGLGFDVRPGLVKADIAGTGHALEIETSMGLVIEPEMVHLDRAITGSRILPLSPRYIGKSGKDHSKGVIYHSGLTGFDESGTLGDPTMATKEEGEKILTAIISDVADIIVQIMSPKK